MLASPRLAAVGSYCDLHPNASSCSTDSIGAVVFAFIIVGVIVALAIFNWWWKHGNPDSVSPLTRAFLWTMRRFKPRNR
jgi:hypothetical protein